MLQPYEGRFTRTLAGMDNLVVANKDFAKAVDRPAAALW